MEKPKPTQSLEQKQETPEDYVVATFPVDTDPDNARRPLTVIRSGQDGEGVKYDRGWNPIGMSVVCDTDSEEGIGPIKLLMEAYKLVGTNIKTEFVPLEDIQGLNEDYIKYLYGKTPKEMIEEAKQIWRQKHPDSEWNELLDVKASPETPSDDLDTEDNSEKSLNDEVSLAMGSLAVKTVEVSPVKTNEIGIDSPVLKIPESTMELIRATEVNGSVGLPAVEPAKKPAETDKVGTSPADLVVTEPVEKPIETSEASTDSVNLSAAKSVENPVVEKPMETNEANVDILPEDFKIAIDSFKQLTEENNGKFFAKAQYITGELNQLRRQIQINPAVIYGLNSEEFMKGVSNKIRDLEDSRAEDTNKFKNDVSDLIEELKKKIENDDERSRLVKLTKHVDKMGENNIVLGRVTKGLLDKLIRIRSYIAESQSSSWGIDYYKSSISQVINEIISDLSTASGRRWSIVGGIEGIRSEGYCQKR